METYDSIKSDGSGRKIIFAVIAIVVLGVLAIGGYYLMKKSGGNVPVASVSPTPKVDSILDSDSDTIPDAVEKAIGTNPAKMDTDGDGFNDLAEIKSGYSPLVAGSAKLTLEDLQILKDKIKAADNDFYENNFAGEKESKVSSVPSPTSSSIVSVKKCEFPEKIGEYSKQIVENIPLYDEKDKTKVTGQGLFLSYYHSNLDIINGLFINFDSEGEVKVLTSDSLKNGGESCNIGNIAGVCVFKGDLANNDNSLGLDFSWNNGKTVKTAITVFPFFSLTKEEAANLKSIEEIKEKVKKNLIPFVVQFKDCVFE